MSEDNNNKKKVLFDNNEAKHLLTPQDIQNQHNQSILEKSADKLNDELIRSLVGNATGTTNRTKKIPRIAFVEDPYNNYNYAGLYKIKKDLVPDNVIKQIRVQNFLVAAILRARGNTISLMSHIRKDRFDTGIDVDIKPEFKDHILPEQMIKIKERIDRFLALLINCGNTDGVSEKDKMTLPEFMDIQTRNGLSFGRFATEIVYYDPKDSPTGERSFNRFRPVDAATIVPLVPKAQNAAEGLRRAARSALEQLTGEKQPKNIPEDDSEYAWIQIVDGVQKQAFKADELLNYNLYPSSDIEHNGYPVTPIDTVLTSLTTHASIELYNKLYFQNGKAAKGMLVINSDEIDQATLEDIKQGYNASINNVTNSFRTPVFGVGLNDQVKWVPTTANAKDGEFEFLFDQVTRNILSAFNMSPDELPGFTHLSRGTNQSALSESNNEFKLLAARDTGIRPLILKMQDFLNEKLFPLMDPELSQLCNITLAGFDAETREQESQRLERDMGIHYSYDEIMEEVDKAPVGPAMGGNFPFNERYRQILDGYLDTGKVISFFMDSPSAIVDPMLKFKKDPFFMQWIQLMAQYNPEALQAYVATREDSMDILKLFLIDYLEEDDV